MSQSPVVHRDVSAFCLTCPQPQDVTRVLQAYGFRLSFEMKADAERAYLHLPPLPAQFHYDGPSGISVVYLAGKDYDEANHQPVPSCIKQYASRFWLYAGGNPTMYEQMKQVLATRYSLSWLLTEGNVAVDIDEIADVA